MKAEQLRKVELDRLQHELESMHHYLNGIRNGHRMSYSAMIETLLDVLHSVYQITREDMLSKRGAK